MLFNFLINTIKNNKILLILALIIFIKIFYIFYHYGFFKNTLYISNILYLYSSFIKNKYLK